MAYQIQSRPFDSLTEYVVTHSVTGEQLSVIPERGGMLRQLLLRAGDRLVPVLAAPETPQALLTDPGYSSAFLFPFPSRIRSGTYTFDGQTYTFPHNDFGRPNAIHGLIAHEPFQLIEQSVNGDQATLTLRYEADGSHPAYPFPYALEVQYQLSPGRLTIHFHVANKGHVRFPAAFGWHPYFRLGETSVDDLTLELPAAETIELDDSLLPVGVRPFEERGQQTLRGRSFDNIFRTAATDEPLSVSKLSSPEEQLTLCVGQDEAFPFVVVYTPDHRRNIAIEPLTANVDSFNNGDGLTILEPGGSFGGRMEVWLT